MGSGGGCDSLSDWSDGFDKDEDFSVGSENSSADRYADSSAPTLGVR